MKRSSDEAYRETRFVELLLVIDFNLYRQINQNETYLIQFAKDLVNEVNGLFKRLNVLVILAGVEIWKDKNEIKLSNNSSIMLNNFNIYANDVLAKKYNYDAAHLLTKTRFTKAHLGLAKKMTICQKNLAVGVQTLVSWNPENQASTCAHELGHNLGMDHDQSVPNCKCEAENGDCIMNAEAKSNSLKKVWSSCSVDKMEETFKQGFDVCLYDNKKSPEEYSTCGNGILDEGEDCDCGLEKFCKNPCCNPKTCKKRKFAKCASGECCNLLTCKIKEKGVICRPSTEKCDLTENCDGQSEKCPDENHEKDFSECDHGNYCYKSKCPNRDEQCQKIFGAKSKALTSGECFFSYGNPIKNYCDRLRCSVERGGLPVLSYYQSFSKRISGNCTFFPRNEDSEFGITSDGVKCGNGMLCLNSVCVNLAVDKKRDLEDELPLNIDNNLSTSRPGENWQNYLIVGTILMILVVTCLIIKWSESRSRRKSRIDAIGEKLAYAPQFVKNPHATERTDEIERHNRAVIEVQALVHSKRNVSI